MDAVVTIVLFCVAWFAVTAVGGTLGVLVGSALRPVGGIGFATGFLGVGLSIAVFSWLDRSPLLLSLAVVVGFLMNDVRRFGGAIPGDPQSELLATYQMRDLLAIVPGGLVAWLLFG